MLVARASRIGRGRLAVFFASAVLSYLPFTVLASDDWGVCRTPNAKGAAAACAKVIESHEVQGHDLAIAYLNRGLGLMATGDNYSAIANFSEALKLEPKFFEAVINRGAAYQELGQYASATADLTQAIALNPKSSAAFTNLGIAYSNTGQYVPESLEAYKKAIDLDPTNVRALNNRCYVYNMLKLYSYAKVDCEQATKRDPKYTLGFIGHGIATWNLHENQDAIQDYTQAIKLDDKRAATYSARSLAYLDLGDFDRAIEDLNHALVLDSGDPSIWNNRCWARAAKRDLKQALPDCDKALSLDSNHLQAFDSRGFVYLKLEDWDRSIADYSAALKMDPHLVSSLYGRGLARQKKGDLAGGKEDLTRARASQRTIDEEFAKW